MHIFSIYDSVEMCGHYQARIHATITVLFLSLSLCFTSTLSSRSPKHMAFEKSEKSKKKVVNFLNAFVSVLKNDNSM